MPNWLSQLKNVVWTAFFALASGVIAVIAGVMGADASTVLGFGLFGLIMANLSSRG